MKKFVLLLTTVLTLAFAASCFATENSSALNDAEGSAQKVITALVASDTLGYKDAEKAMSADLAKQMNVNTFIAMQRQVQEKFGKHKETKFFSFERFDTAWLHWKYSKTKNNKIFYGHAPIACAFSFCRNLLK